MSQCHWLLQYHNHHFQCIPVFSVCSIDSLISLDLVGSHAHGSSFWLSSLFLLPPQFRTGQIVPMSWGVLVRKVILKQPNTTNFWFQKVYFFQYPSDSFVHQGHHCHEYNLWILQVNPGEFIDSLKWYRNIFTILLSITIFYLVLIPKFKPLKASKVASFSFVDCKSSGNVYIDTQVPQLKRSV